MTDTIKPLSVESERLMETKTKNLITAMKEFEDSFAEVQKIEKVMKPNDNNWIYAMNNFTTSMYSSSNFPAEMAQKNRVLFQSYEIAYSELKSFCEKEHYYKSWEEIPAKDTNVSKIQPVHIKEYNDALGL